MLRYERIKTGIRIRAYDFQPIEGRGVCYVEGVVIRRDLFQGAKGLVVKVDVDVFGGEQIQNENHSRVGQEVFVPMQITPLEFDNRVQILDYVADIDKNDVILALIEVLRAEDNRVKSYGSDKYNQAIARLEQKIKQAYSCLGLEDEEVKYLNAIESRVLFAKDTEK